MKADILTIFPGFFSGPLDHGITRRACEMGLAKIEVHDLRQFTHDRHRTVGDRPFGGGEGMVLKPEPLFESVEALNLASREERAAAKQSVVLLSAQGRRFDQGLAVELALLSRLVLICGRYEGVDERVGTHLADREISIGDYVLSGGEPAALIVIDAAVRLLPGALGSATSAANESFSDGMLACPQYTRPQDFEGMRAPEVFLNGHHAEIARWRQDAGLKKTKRNRPDLLK